MRLIDLDAIPDNVYWSRDALAEALVNAPIIEERKPGKWILCNEQRKEDTDNGNFRYLCSNCNYADIHAKSVKVPFCWHCGCKMKGEQP